jgi:hypothetical protein
MVHGCGHLAIGDKGIVIGMFTGIVGGLPVHACRQCVTTFTENGRDVAEHLEEAFCRNNQQWCAVCWGEAAGGEFGRLRE